MSEKTMANDIDWKRFQFITEVQTALITNAIDILLDDDAKDKRDIFSATGTLIRMDDAFHAADKIPKDMTAHEAACVFIEFICDNLREKDATVPYWFARY